MPALLFDTASDAVVVAVTADDGELVAGASERGIRAQSLLAVVDRVLVDAGLTLAGIDRLGVGTGPGGFTGLRVGIATARGLASATGLPLAALPTLATLAWPLASAQPAGERVWASLDARRGERFVQPMRMVSGIAGMSLIPLADARAVPAAEVAALVGDDPVADDVPTPEGLAGYARLAAFRDDPMEILPDYGRDPDATPPAAAVAHGGGGAARRD